MASPKAARDYLTMRLGAREHEVFTILFLDSRHRLIDCLELFRGTIDGASVHPREVVKEALKRNATAVILSHNHPSGVAEPSQADEIITTRLRDALALALVEIRVLDHLIVAGPTVTSLAERGARKGASAPFCSALLRPAKHEHIKGRSKFLAAGRRSHARHDRDLAPLSVWNSY